MGVTLCVLCCWELYECKVRISADVGPQSKQTAPKHFDLCILHSLRRSRFLSQQFSYPSFFPISYGPTGFFISSLTFTYPHSIFFPQPSRFFLTIFFISFPHTVFFLFKSSLFSTQFVSYFLAFFPSLSFFFYSFRILSLFHFDLFYHSLLFSRLILISTEFSLIRQKPNVTNWDRKIVLQQSLKWGGDV